MSTTPHITAHLTETAGRILITHDGVMVREIANTGHETPGTWLVVTGDQLGCVRIEATDSDQDTAEALAAECSAWNVWAAAVQLQAHDTPTPTVEALLADSSGRLDITVDGVRARQLPAGPLTAAGRWVAVVQLDTGTIGIGCVHTDREVVERYVTRAAGLNVRWAAACQVQ